MQEIVAALLVYQEYYFALIRVLIQSFENTR